MGKSKLFQGIVVGAIAGGLISLLDPSTRKYVREKTVATGKAAQYYVSHPSESFHQIRECYETGYHNFAQLTNQAIVILNQIQDSVKSLEDNEKKID